MWIILNLPLWICTPSLMTYYEHDHRPYSHCLELFITLYTKVQSFTNNSLLYIYFIGNVVKSLWAIFLDQCAGLVAPLAGNPSGAIVHNSSKRNQLQIEFNKQECIPVGCVPSAAVAISPAMKCPPAMHAPCYPCPPPPHMPSLPCTSPCYPCPHHACPLPSMSPLPRQTPPPPRWPLKWAVCILLECIFV